MAKTLEKGSFQDPRGNAVNAGTVEFVLSQDAAIIVGGQVAPTLVSATLTSSGDMPGSFTILANDELTPSGTFYLVTVFDSNGARVFGPERWVLSGASPIDLDNLVPTIVDPAFADPILANPAASQTISGFPLITDISTATSATSNALRLLISNNSDNSHTGDTAATDIITEAIAGATIGATGEISFAAAGTITGSAGNKTIKALLGSKELMTTGDIAGTADWFIEGQIINTATNAQRILMKWSTHANTTNFNMDYITATEDTTANINLRIKITLANSADTVTATMFNVYIAQI